MCLGIGLVPGCGDLSALHPVPAVPVGTKACELRAPNQKQSETSTQGIVHNHGDFLDICRPTGSVSALQEEV